MATEQILDGQYFRRLKDATNNVWERLSFWTKAKDVYFEDGSDLETKMSSSGTGGSSSIITTGTKIIDTSKVQWVSSTSSFATYVMSMTTGGNFIFVPLLPGSMQHISSTNKNAQTLYIRKKGTTDTGFQCLFGSDDFRVANIQELNYGSCAFPSNEYIIYLIWKFGPQSSKMSSWTQGTELETYKAAIT